jgi:ribonuclease Y
MAYVQLLKRKLALLTQTLEKTQQQHHHTAQSILSDAQQKAEQERLSLKSHAQEKLNNTRESIKFTENHINQHTEELKTVSDHLQTEEDRLNAHAQQLQGQSQALQQTLNERFKIRNTAFETLCKQSGFSRASALEHLREQHISQQTLLLQQHIHTHNAETAESAPSHASRILGLIGDRYSGVGHQERIQNTFPHTEAPCIAPLLNQDSATAAFLQHTGAEAVPDANAQVVSVRGDDPLAREIGRRLIRHALQKNIPLDAANIQRITPYITQEIHKEVAQAGHKAVQLLQLTPVHEDILHLVGRLKFRLSYSQNQWKHAIEVAYLAGMMAEELKLDIQLARRGGLLHDIGKAMTHDHEGSHAVLGAQVARRCKEDERVANAIGSHHNDEPPTHALAHIVTAADAMSGARPGARRDTSAQYLTLIDDIYDIVGSFNDVQRIDIMQGGREVRVTVPGALRGDLSAHETPPSFVVPDHALHPLAQDIARALEEELVFPGQIRVTVVRESRSIAIAQ